MARINVDPDAWSALRVTALKANRSLADVLGELVEETVDRSECEPPRRVPAKSTRNPRLVPVTPRSRPSSEASPRPSAGTYDGWVPPWEG